MDMPQYEMFTQLGVVGITAIIVWIIYLIVKLFIGKRPKEDDGLLAVMSKQLHELYVWHNKEDEEGVKIWYVRKSLEDAIKALSLNIAEQTKVLQSMVIAMNDNQLKISEIGKEVNKLVTK